jgi:cohesin loading factor subunit SCC2
MDTGVSVRKRVIKIIRDVCLSNAGFSKTTDGCLRIISRINDEETSIQVVVRSHFVDLLFSTVFRWVCLHS